jgi:cell division septal protein FtsQ
MAKNKKNSRNFIMALIFLPVVAVALSAYAVYKGVVNYVTTSYYFKIRDVKVEGIADPRYVGLMREEIVGNNIFCVDSGKVSERIKRRFPTLTRVTVTRVLPSELLVVAHERVPVAVLRRDAAYLFDTQGVAISSFPLSETVDFPVIAGLEKKISAVRVGMSYNSGVLKEALHLARVLRLQRFALDASLPQPRLFGITKIDCLDPSNFSFYLGDNLQVKVGHSDFENKIALLPSILKSLSQEIASVQYIDLRPNEPAVALKKEVRKK